VETIMATPLTVEDLARFALPTEIALSPDGRRLAFIVLSQDVAEDKRHAHLWLLGSDTPGAAPRQFTRGDRRDRQPSWSPDGRQIAFVSDLDGDPQIWIIPADGGEARKLTSMRHGAHHPRWSPDGTQILFAAEVREGESPLRDREEDEKKAGHAEATRLRHVTRLQYRWDGGDVLEGRTHLWLIAAGEPASDPRQITSGDFDYSEAAWSPDGTQIAFTCDRADDRNANRTNAVWVMTLATGEIVQVSSEGSNTKPPTWSPDGTMLAWRDMPLVPDASISNAHILVAARNDGGAWSLPRDLLAGHDLSADDSFTGQLTSYAPTEPVWSADGRWIWFTAVQRGQSHLWRVSLAGGDLQRVTTGEEQVGPLAVAADGQCVCAVVLGPRHAPEIARFSLEPLPATAPEVLLTDLNPWLRERTLSTPQAFTFRAPDGWEIEGWVLLPPDAGSPDHAGRRWPGIVQIHGGPHSFYGPGFHFLLQIFAGAGYAAIAINPRGSTGYGEAFARACDRDWGGGDYHDIMAGVDAALARFPIDPDRLAVTGTSYGGYMTNWIIGHETRFKAAVTINSVSNLTSSFGTSDVDAVFGVVEQGGDPWNRQAFYWERSPIAYMPAVTTPTRIIGAERDWRCPIEQSEQVFIALRYLRRVETDFIRVPGASHSINLGTPGQRVAQSRAILEWIQRFAPAGP
jgi:dipeptidyl aminopeptidase/acylaminoacyl peptidase